MMRSLWTGASGMVAQQLNIDVISNNLANVNTTGFKKSRAEFEDLMYQNMKIAGSITEGDNILPVGIQVGMGVRPTAVHKFFTQGDFQNTGNALDVAIEGDGFFQVDVNGELMYTRAGSFKLNHFRAHRGPGCRRSGNRGRGNPAVYLHQSRRSGCARTQPLHAHRSLGR